MMKCSLSSLVVLLLLAVLAIIFSQSPNAAISARVPAVTFLESGQIECSIACATAETGPLTLAHYLDTAFCRESLCAPGDWGAWIILEPSSQWTVEELTQVRNTLLITIKALDEAGFDGQALLSGYRFRRLHGEPADHAPGRIARVHHDAAVIALADEAFLRLWGWYVYHELGHVIDLRLDREPQRRFHALIDSRSIPGSEETAAGFWLNEHARFDHGESAADAIALWIVMRYTDHPRPVFWLMPNDTDYEKIAGTMEKVLYEIGQS